MRKITPRIVCEMARAMAGVSEKDHFGSDAFIANGRIFVTVWHDKKEVTLMLNQEQQKSILVQDDSDGFNQISGAWGLNGINVQLEFVRPKVFEDALHLAWVNSANKRVMPRRKGSADERAKKPTARPKTRKKR